MRALFPRALLVLPSLASCGGDERDDTTPPPAIIQANFLEPNEQQLRLSGCERAKQSWREQGIWQSGGVRPRIDATDWNGLDKHEREAILSIAACLGTAGQIARVEVVVESATTGSAVHVETMRSDRAFPEPIEP